MPLYKHQLHNALTSGSAVAERARERDWNTWEAFHMFVLVLMCQRAESNLWNYGSYVYSDSFALADPVPLILRPVIRSTKWMGSDHLSVGTFQQQVPMWGTLQDCMDVKKACHKFMNSATAKGVDTKNGMPNRLDVQKVQVSFDPTGGNYATHFKWAHAFAMKHWDHEQRKLREASARLISHK